MNWDAIGAVGQVLGSLAVFVTLGYLSVQVRYAREQAKQALEGVQREAIRTRLRDSREIFVATATDAQLSSALARLPQSMGNAMSTFQRYAMTFGLTEGEGRQVYTFYWALWQNFQASIEVVEHLSSGVKDEFDQRLRANYCGEGAAAKWYEVTKPTLNPVAVRYVDDLLAQTSTP